MPRKKQGLRSYHQKSRNGCLQCKRRRVRCNMQAPSCANCTRRGEVCKYAGIIITSTSMMPWHKDIADGPMSLCESPKTTFIHASQYEQCNLPNREISLTGNGITTGISIGSILDSVLERSWFTPIEARMWSHALLKDAGKHSYLQHCILSVACLRRDLLDTPSTGRPSAAAYEHQMAASALFRQGATTVDRDNWLATLAFHVFMLVFQFGSQSACSDDQFDLVDTLRVLRSSNAIEEEAKPYFRTSRLWELIVIRARAEKFDVDQTLRTNLLALGRVIAESTTSNANKAAINYQALSQLGFWIFSCGAHPRRWDQYCDWPGHLDPGFLDLLTNNDDVALLLVIHWSAVMYRSQKPAVYHWARRAALYATGQLKDRKRWESLLVWPLQALHERKDAQQKTPNMEEQSRVMDMEECMDTMNMGKDAHYHVPAFSCAGACEHWPNISQPLKDQVAFTAIQKSNLRSMTPPMSATSVDEPYMAATSVSFDSAWLLETSESITYSSISTILPEDEEMLIDPSLLPLDGSAYQVRSWPANGLELGLGMNMDGSPTTAQGTFA